jgi:hypothetical protein
MNKKKIKLLITAKTSPIPSKKYDELVCTVGVTEEGEFVRLYPVNFRELPFDQQYRKYSWIEVEVAQHKGDPRKESYRPNCDTITPLEFIKTKNGDWSERAKYVMTNKAVSIEELKERQARDRTSLGIFKPKKIHDLVIRRDEEQWPARFIEELRQQRIFETRNKTLQPPRKMPYKFLYRFECDDERCTTRHEMSIIDWEVSAFFWREVDRGLSHDDAAQSVKNRFLNELCAPTKDTHFYVGTIKLHPKNWVILGVWWPKQKKHPNQTRLF